MRSKKNSIILQVVVACIVMGVVDAVIRPEYITKSGIKILMFVGFPILYKLIDREYELKKVLKPSWKGFKHALGLGLVVYIIILGAYLVLRQAFDFSQVVVSLEDSVGVSSANFIWIATYIALINSLLEEFFFRGFAFFTLKEVSSRKTAYLFSSFMFALYHIAMMIGWFRIELVILALIGLFVGGSIFNFCNEKTGNIYISWLVHMCANFAINTVGFILFGIINI